MITQQAGQHSPRKSRAGYDVEGIPRTDSQIVEAPPDALIQGEYAGVEDEMGHRQRFRSGLQRQVEGERAVFGRGGSRR